MMRCYRCGGVYGLEAFSRDRSKASGRKSICKPCDREKHRREYNERRRVPPTESVCVECGAAISGRKDRLLCDNRQCKDRRYQRLHPDEYKAKRRRKDARRYEQQRAGRSAA